PFFSRRIGLRVPIIGGIRLSGNLDENWRLGVMDIQTQADQSQDLSAQNFGVFTLQKKVLDRSNISLLFVNKQETTSNGVSKTEFNRNIGLEYNYFSEDNLWNGKLLFLQSFSPVKDKSGAVFASHIGYQSTRWNWKIQQEYVSGNYSAEVGFIPRNNFFKLESTAGHLIYTQKETSLLSHGPSIGRTYYFDTDFGKKDQTDQFKYRLNFKNRSRLSVGINRQYIELLSDFDPLRTQLG
ncbi:MAG: hydrolase, partial [Flavobacteriaceae bacterium]